MHFQQEQRCPSIPLGARKDNNPAPPDIHILAWCLVDSDECILMLYL